MEIQIQRFTRIQGDSDTEIYTDTLRFRYRGMRINGDFKQFPIQRNIQIQGDFREIPIKRNIRVQVDSDTKKYTDTGIIQIPKNIWIQVNSDTEKYSDT